MSLGPVMLDLAGTVLSEEDRELLRHPAVGGVILFRRNFENAEQLAQLCAQIHDLRTPPLLIAVDQEGGRVQRFCQDFTRLPPPRRLGELAEHHPKQAQQAAQALGWLMAAELRALGVDFSFAPVLDLDQGISKVIGDRAFASQPELVTELAAAWCRGARSAGMASVGKHFPGHGGVRAVSHKDLPVDPRPLVDLEWADLIPFARLIQRGLEAIMPAHVIYDQVDAKPAGFSARWLGEILRQELEFQGAIFSDDLSMAAAAVGGTYEQRAREALKAGCDMLLVCNNRLAAIQVVEALGAEENPTRQLRCLRMHGRGTLNRAQLHLDPRWQSAVRIAAQLDTVEMPDFNF